MTTIRSFALVGCVLAQANCLTTSDEPIVRHPSGPITPWDICGPTTDYQDVNRYDGTLGVDTRYVWKHEHAVGMLHINTDPESWCSGTFIGDSFFLTAQHCVDDPTAELTIITNFEKPFRDDEPWLTVREHGITIEEDGEALAGLDYAILRVSGINQTRRQIAMADPPVGARVTIIQHPTALEKKTDTGPVLALFPDDDGHLELMYQELDTLPGSSGAGILDTNGFLVGVHVDGGCAPMGGTNQGVPISEILAVSPIVSAIVAGPQPDTSAGDVHVGHSDGARFLDRGYAEHFTTCATGFGTCAIGDVTGDGKADLVHFRQDGSPDLLTRAQPAPTSGTQFVGPTATGQTACLPNHVCKLADVNGDGRADAVEFTNDGAADVFVSISSGIGFGGRTLFHSSFCSTGMVCDVGDVNNDGRADVIAFTRGTSGNVFVARSMGTSFGPMTLFHANFCFVTDECRIGDVNGDGRADAVAFTRGTSKDVNVALSTGTSFGVPTVFNDTFCGGTSRCEVADVTGDGRADAIEFTQGNDGGDVNIARSTGTMFLAPTLGHPALCFSGHTCLLGDVDGDGRADAVALQRGG